MTLLLVLIQNSSFGEAHNSLDMYSYLEEKTEEKCYKSYISVGKEKEVFDLCYLAVW